MGDVSECKENYWRDIRFVSREISCCLHYHDTQKPIRRQRQIPGYDRLRLWYNSEYAYAVFMKIPIKHGPCLEKRRLWTHRDLGHTTYAIWAIFPPSEGGMLRPPPYKSERRLRLSIEKRGQRKGRVLELTKMRDSNVKALCSISHSLVHNLTPSLSRLTSTIHHQLKINFWVAPNRWSDSPK